MPLMQAAYPAMRGKFVFVEDDGHIHEPALEPLRTALAMLPAAVRRRIDNGRPELSRNSDAYIAGSMAVYDASGGVKPASPNPDAALIAPRYLITLASPEDEPLYEARMAARQHGVAVPGMVEATGQLFLHDIAPEQAITHAEGRI